MTLDFHLAKSQKQAPYVNTSACFDEYIHEYIFHETGLSDNTFPLFNRMADYYKDTHYHLAEIESLANEISRIKQLFAKSSTVQKQLSKIEVVCVKAMQSNLSIWVFSD